MMTEEYYPQRIEHYASRNFLIGTRVATYHQGKWYTGTVVRRDPQKNAVPYVMIKTDEKVDDDIAAYLDGFGIEIQINSPRVIFERELVQRDPLFTTTYTREMTAEEKKDHDDCPF